MVACIKTILCFPSQFLSQLRSTTIFFGTLLSNQAVILAHTHKTNCNYPRLSIEHHKSPQYPSLTSTSKGTNLPKLPLSHERNLLTPPKPSTHHLNKPATMSTAATTTTPASSPLKRTSEQAGFTTSPLPKHRKLTTALPLAVRHNQNGKPGEKTAPYALPPPLTGQQLIDVERLDRTWTIEFDSPIPIPNSPESHHSTKKASLWRLLDCKRYDDCKVRVAVLSLSPGQLRLMCSVKLPSRCRLHFQGCMHPRSCEGRFVWTAITMGGGDE